ncbi:DMT family transporter [Paenibacillus durus]|uniref:Ligand-binding protein SH3 n=1 Tax=Paenibacillus durus ATCC 35681 TaxID=1333534 RepID=A0A0F7FC61_PAEDU|nr:multidrug efflux SMR transporter [Paenibacillus durus]AKG35882.1 hypothetical protein VK70_16015 [Paenibacillus durus ATCC 35681]
MKQTLQCPVSSTGTKAAWMVVIAGGLMDVVWAVLLDYSEGLTVLWPSVFALAAITVSYFLYVLSLKLLPAGTAYTVFTGIGTAGTGLIGILFLGEPAGGWRIFFIGMLLLGITRLKLASGGETVQPKGGELI